MKPGEVSTPPPVPSSAKPHPHFRCPPGIAWPLTQFSGNALVRIPKLACDSCLRGPRPLEDELAPSRPSHCPIAGLSPLFVPIHLSLKQSSERLGMSGLVACILWPKKNASSPSPLLLKSAAAQISKWPPSCWQPPNLRLHAVVMSIRWASFRFILFFPAQG